MPSLLELPRLAADRLARRLHGPEHFIVFRDHGFVYARVPKAANSTIKATLSRLIQNRRAGGVSADDYWRSGTEGQTWMLRTRDAAALGPERLIFSFVRNPLTRLASFYDNKVQGEGALPLAAQRMGITKSDSFARVVDIVCETASHRMDVHAMPQADMLVHAGRLVPSFVGRYESLSEDWERLRQAILAAGGTDPGPLRTRRRKGSGRSRDLADYYSEARLEAAVRRRYAEDFRLFYPEQA